MTGLILRSVTLLHSFKLWNFNWKLNEWKIRTEKSFTHLLCSNKKKECKYTHSCNISRTYSSAKQFEISVHCFKAGLFLARMNNIAGTAIQWGTNSLTGDWSCRKIKFKGVKIEKDWVVAKDNAGSTNAGRNFLSFRYYWQCLSKRHLFSECRCTKAVPCTDHAKQVKLVLLIYKLWLNTTLIHIQNTTIQALFPLLYGFVSIDFSEV